MKLTLVLLIGIASLTSAQRFRGRQGRQGGGYLAPAPSDTAENSYLAPAPSDGEAAAPADNYGAASDLDYDEYDPNDVPADQAAPISNYGVEEQPAYEPEAAAADEGDMGLKMLMTSVPGVPGEDYPILADVPETAFSCEGQVEGGYYADSEADCQVFHICTADGQGGLGKYSFLCPNGTIFNQNYFICDWWFNFDCAEADAIAAEKNGELAAAREEASAAAADAAASNADASYAAPADNGYGAPAEAASDVEADLAGYNARR